MPRYFFHVVDGQRLPDLTGTEFDYHEQARVEAVRLGGHLMIDAPEALGDGHEWQVEVTDDRNTLLYLLTIVMAPTAVAVATSLPATDLDVTAEHEAS